MDEQQNVKNICQKWQNISLWSLDEACKLCIEGIDPETGVSLLLDNDQKAPRPKKISTRPKKNSTDLNDLIRSDIQLFAGGITTVEAEYDEQLGAVLYNGIQYRYNNEEIDITDLIGRATIAGDLQTYRRDDEHNFKPEDIINWLNKNISSRPPMMLLDGFITIHENSTEKPLLSKAKQVKNHAERYGPQFINDYYHQHREEPKKPIVTTEFYKKLPHIVKETIARNFTLTELTLEAKKQRSAIKATA